ncbi:UV-stimulated scaffold protein A homolog [Magnolia sinica]|uniref:UV-stimulated scaffold protein A homolog n=1 Tax=Magnolia sinica TaxID=86752 RepID=UPI0026588DD5|nr:UV-stimulated scaffold protein A homolog [Magnolia sinica]
MEGEKLLALIEKATNSTSQEVDPRLLKAVKSTVRSSDDNVRIAIDSLMQKMKKDHSQVRYLTLLIIDELFMRSKLFRSLLVVNFDNFLSLSVGFRRNLPLPPPRAVASTLRSKSIELLEKWNASFGIHYRQLRLGFEYLKNTLKFQFPNRLENAARLQQERREREIRSKEILLSKYGTLKENYASIKGEIQSTLDEIGECLDIICVKEDEFIHTNSVEDGEAEEYSSALQQIRLESLKEGEKVSENSDNKAVFDVLRDLYKLLLSRHLPLVQELVSVLVRVDLADNKFRDFMLKEFIDIRKILQSLKKRCEQTGCALHSTAAQEEEDLWEEGKIEVPDNENARMPTRSSKEIVSTSTTNADQGKVPDHGKKLKGKALNLEGDGSDSTSPRVKLLAEAPVMPWGSFLDNWGSDRDFLANQRGLELEGHWGRVDYDAVIPAEKIAELNVQTTLYKEQKVEIQPCLAPMSKGGLCQRRDLRVCPFHGPIVPRDAEGIPIHQNLSTDEKAVEDLLTGFLDGEDDHDLGNTMAKKLAKQAVKNVRNRDREEEKKRENDRRSLKRAKLAKVREHNEAVLRESALASTSRSEAVEEDLVMGNQGGPIVRGKKQTLSSMLREKVTTKDRIARRLLNTRVTDAAIRQLRQVEEANYKEAYPNQW